MEDIDLVYLAGAITAVTADTQTQLVAADVELPQTDNFMIPFGSELRILAGEDVLLEPVVEACDEIFIVVTLREDGTATVWINRTEYADLRVPIRIDSSWRTAN
jgi:hypothetical protein